MFRNYFKTALRNFWKNKTSSFINIIGLTIGLTSCLLIGLYIQHERSYDHFQQNGKRLARVIMEYKFDGSSEFQRGNFTSVRVARVFKKTFPEVESAVTIDCYGYNEPIVRYGDKVFSEKKFAYADSTFFDMFSFPLLAGNTKDALSGPYHVVITQSVAKKYFGTENPIGKLLSVGADRKPYQITGLVADCPSNSQIKFDFLASFASQGLEKEWYDTYWDANYTTYLLLRNESSIASLQRKIPVFMKKEMQGQGATVNFLLEPFLDIHLHSPYGGFEPNNSISYLYILAAVALLILVIACSTFINLSTARSVERAREVGVRKVIGAFRKQLFWQFLAEAFSFCLIAALISVASAILLLPYFNQISERQLAAGAFFSLPFLLFILIVIIGVSLLAGSYPALILSGFQPVKVLKGSFKNTGSGQWLRKSLILFQFTISVFLIVSTFLVQKQLTYIQHKKLGFDRDHVVVLPMEHSMLDRIDLIKSEFKSIPDIISVSRCVRSPVEGGGGYNMRSSVMPEDKQLLVTANPVDEDYVKTVGLQLVAGSDLTKQDILDANRDSAKLRFFHFILNETAARQLGWSPEEAIGQKMFLGGDRPGVVRGVVKNFHYESLHNPVGPFILFPEWRGRELLVKVSGQRLTQTLSALESKWKSLVTDRPFEYHFLDEDYNKLYNAEIRLGKLMNIFAAVAIILACLGLYGLSAYAAQQRIKEIGIRKVLGASIQGIVFILSKNFLWLAAMSMLIAFPLAWWASAKWLADFSYRTALSWDIFAVAGLLTLFLAMATVSFHAFKAAWTNPVKNLRTE